MWEGREVLFLYCEASTLWRWSKFRMQIFREKDNLSRKAKTLLFLLVTAKLVNTVQPGQKKKKKKKKSAYPDRSTTLFISLLHFKISHKPLTGRGGTRFFTVTYRKPMEWISLPLIDWILLIVWFHFNDIYNFNYNLGIVVHKPRAIALYIWPKKF